MRNQNVTTPPMYIKTKALGLVQKMNISEVNASYRWCEGFTKRYQLKSIQLFGEGGSFDMIDPVL